MCHNRWYIEILYLTGDKICFNLFPGSYLSAIVTFCSCETEVETLIRNHLFPATPKQPQLVFTFKLLDWLEVLLLECHVAVQDFVSAVNSLSRNKLLQVHVQ